MVNTANNKLSNEDYENLISKTFKDALVKEKTIVSGSVISVDNDLVTIDVGSKSEGRIPLSEFHRPGQKPEINVGDSFDVFIETNAAFFTSSPSLESSKSGSNAPS